MPKWDQWINDDNEELVDDYQTFKKMPKKKHNEDYVAPPRKESLRVPKLDKE